MDQVLIARVGMASSLAFHIVFAMAGMSLPVLVVAADLAGTLRGDPDAAELARRWSKGLAVLFAVGAVSGTVLSFELGLLWPGFMERAGPAVGFLFAAEGFAFFLEAIFLGIYLYGGARIGAGARLAAGVGVALMGNLSAVFIVLVNGWMNDPVGVRFEGGRLVELDPWAILTNPTGWGEVVHMVLAAGAAVPLLMAGIHAYELRRDPGRRLHRVAMALALACAAPAVLSLPVTGHALAQRAAVRQPAKLAAMEAHWETASRAPLVLGGWPDEAARENHLAIEIPGALSWLATGDIDAEIRGWSSFPADARPPVLPVHLAFQVMVGCGSLMVGLMVLSAERFWRGGAAVEAPWYLGAVTLAAPLGLAATQAGWVVTEVGRQPWVIAGVMRTAAAATALDPGTLALRTGAFLLVYLVLALTVLRFLRAYVRQARRVGGGSR